MTGVAVLVLSLGASFASSQVPGSSYRNRLLGVFSDQTGEPIEGAAVIDIVGRTTALTTRTGTVSLAYLPDGGSLVRIQKIGYRPVTILISISPDDTVPLTIVLSSFAQTLPAVVTTDSAPRYLSPRLRGFEERRNQGAGYFVGEGELRKEDHARMTSVIRSLPGVKINCGITGQRRGECWAASGRIASRLGGGSCPFELYVDGVVYTDNDLEKLRVDEYAAVELYAGAASIPPQYNRTGSACGVLLLWTREK